MNPSFSEDSVAETTCLKNIKNSDGKSTRSSPPGPTIRISKKKTKKTKDKTIVTSHYYCI